MRADLLKRAKKAGVGPPYKDVKRSILLIDSIRSLIEDLQSFLAEFGAEDGSIDVLIDGHDAYFEGFEVRCQQEITEAAYEAVIVKAEAAKKKKRLQQAAAREKRLAKTEANERAELARLQEKYGSQP